MTLRNKINEAKAKGIDVISLAIGDPVEATPQPIIDVLQGRRDPANHSLPDGRGVGMRALRDATFAGTGAATMWILMPRKEMLPSSARRKVVTISAWPSSIPATPFVTDPGYPGYKSVAHSLELSVKTFHDGFFQNVLATSE